MVIGSNPIPRTCKEQDFLFRAPQMVATLGDYQIQKGLSEKQIDQLLNFAATDEALKYTSDKERFKDKASFDDFSKHILAYYTLSDEEGNLLGLIWFDDLDLYLNQENPSEYGISFAIRLYGEARGKGLAQEFSEKAMEDFKNSEEYKNHPHPKFWLAVSPENEGAVNLYKKLGYKKLEIEKTHGKLLMIQAS